MDAETRRVIRQMFVTLDQSRKGLERAVQLGHGDTVARHARTLSGLAAQMEALVVTEEHRTLS